MTEAVLPTLAAAAPTLTATATPDEAALAMNTPPPTWTAVPDEATLPPTLALLPTRTPPPTSTPWPTPTNTPTPSMTPTATATAVTPTTWVPLPGAGTPLPAATGPNLLPNPSFEEGWYNLNGIPELQVPNGWLLEWVEGENSLDPDPWNRFVRPETRLLSKDFLPAHEHATFIWDGDHTVKVFKGQGAIHFRLLTDVYLTPGVYELRVHYFPDLVEGYTSDGRKIWAPDPLSGEARIIAPDGGTNWIFPAFGRKNSLTHILRIEEAQTVRIGAAFRGRWAILNNGWFLDDWSLRRLQ